MRKALIIIIVVLAAGVVLFLTSHKVSEPQDAAKTSGDAMMQKTNTSVQGIEQDLNIQVDDGSGDFKAMDKDIQSL